MNKRNKIIYWIATVWLSLGMLSTGIVQLIPMEEEIREIVRLGYPGYILTIIGTWKVLGTVAVLLPGFPRLKEWAYAGFFFVASGAICSHIAVGDPVTQSLPLVLLVVLTVVSWYFRPAGRQLASS